MSSAPTTSQAEDTNSYRAILHDLIEAGAELAHAIQQHAMANKATAADAAIPFERVARTVRRTILLAQHIAEAKPSPVPARKRILREVEDAIQRTAKGPNAENLHAELQDRLDAPDLIDDIATRPIPEIIADICRDLGLGNRGAYARDYKRRTPDDIAALCARAAALLPLQPSFSLRGWGAERTKGGMRALNPKPAPQREPQPAPRSG